MLLKRFWKLVTLMIVIIVVLVTYFVHTSLVVANQFPDLKLNTIKGDPTVLENVFIGGDYYRKGNYSTSLIVTEEGSTYHDELPYFKKMEANFPPTEVTTLKNEYRNFMRSKWGDPASYFEDEHYLAYVKVDSDTKLANAVYEEDFRFVVDVLNKDTKDSASFEVRIPGQEDYRYVHLYDVQLVDGELMVVTNISYLTQSDQSSSEFKVYTINLSSQKITSDETIVVSEMVAGEHWTDTYMLSDVANIHKQTNLLFQKVTMQEGETEVQENDNHVEEVSIEVMDRTVYVYNLETKELRPLPLEQQDQVLLTWGYVNDTHAYVATLTEDSLNISGYRLDNLAEETNITFNLTEQGIENIGDVKFKDNKIYVVDEVKTINENVNILVGDITTGEVLYIGEIVMENPTDENEDYFIQFYNIIIHE